MADIVPQSTVVDSYFLQKLQFLLHSHPDPSPAVDGFVAGIGLTIQLLDPLMRHHDALTTSTAPPTKKSRPSATNSSSTRAAAAPVDASSSSSAARLQQHPTSISTLPTSPAPPTVYSTIAPLAATILKRARGKAPANLFREGVETHEVLSQGLADAKEDAEWWKESYTDLSDKLTVIVERQKLALGLGTAADSDAEDDDGDEEENDEDDEEEDIKPVLDYSSSQEDLSFSSAEPAELPTPRLSRERLIPTRLFAPFLPSASTSTSTSQAPPFWLKGHQPPPPAVAEEDSDDDHAHRRKKGKGKGKGGPRVVQEVEVEQETAHERMARLLRVRQLQEEEAAQDEEDLEQEMTRAEEEEEKKRAAAAEAKVQEDESREHGGRRRSKRLRVA